MGRRLLLTPVLVAFVATTLFGVPVLVIGQDFIQRSKVERLELDAQRAAGLVERARHQGLAVEPEMLDAVVRRDVRVVVREGSRVDTTWGRPVRGPALAADTHVTDGATRLEIRVAESKAGLRSQIRALWMVVVGVGLVAVLVAVGVGIWQGRRLSRPFQELAQVAERLGSGDPRPHGRRYGLPELDRVAEVLDSSATRLSEMLAAERRLAQDATHQIRTPLTALSMRLEEILAADDIDAAREEASIALNQAERLADVVDRLLAVSRGSPGSNRAVVDVDEAIDQQMEEWTPAFDAAERRVELTGERGLSVVGAPGTLAHVVATLLENALHHGGGGVILHTRTTGGGSVVVEISDEGPGVPEELGQRIFERSVSGRSGTGLGLALARDLAEADGGRLELMSRKPAMFGVFLPLWREPESGQTSV